MEKIDSTKDVKTDMENLGSAIDCMVKVSHLS